jgi:hypothetical protein
MDSNKSRDDRPIRQGGQGPGQGRGANPGEMSSQESQPARRASDRATKSGRFKIPASIKRSKPH